jgi:hypothetical protein
MRLAWFRPDLTRTGFDDLAAVIDGLRESHEVTVVTADGAHDFVWQWARGRFDLCVYELDDTISHRFIWPYLVHYPGVLALRSAVLHDSRSLALIHQHRDADYAAEARFADGGRSVEAPWHLVRGATPLWKIPVLASRLTAVADDALAGVIAEACPDVRVAVMPTGVADASEPTTPPTESTALRVVVCEEGTPGAIERAVTRATRAGAAITLAHAAATPDGVRSADVIVATRWPGRGRPLASALLGAAAGKAVIVTETETTAAWPAVDPQSWQLRAVATGVPPTEPAIVISIDPRDEEHSLFRALTRLAADADLRRSLGAAGRSWWSRHATVNDAVRAWEVVLDEARLLAPPSRPAGWPAHLDADSSGLADAILEEFGLHST